MYHDKKKCILGILTLLLIGLSAPQVFSQETRNSLELASKLSEAYVRVAEDVIPAAVTIECVNIYFNSEAEDDAEADEIAPEDMLPGEVLRFLSRMQEDDTGEARAGGSTGTGVIISAD